MQQTRISIGSITTLVCESAILWAIDGVGAHSLRQLWQSLFRARRSSLRGRRFVSPCSVLACHCQRPRVLSASSVGSIDLHSWRRSALELTKLMTAYRKSGAEITRRNEARWPGLNDPGHNLQSRPRPRGDPPGNTLAISPSLRLPPGGGAASSGARARLFSAGTLPLGPTAQLAARRKFQDIDVIAPSPSGGGRGNTFGLLHSRAAAGGVGPLTPYILTADVNRYVWLLGHLALLVAGTGPPLALLNKTTGLPAEHPGTGGGAQELEQRTERPRAGGPAGRVGHRGRGLLSRRLAHDPS